MKFIILFLLYANCLFAAPKNLLNPSPPPAPLLSTTAKAQAEINAIPKTQKFSSTDAKFNGILKLQDPRPQVVTRDWKYFLSLKLQSLQPKGIINNSLVGNFDLAKNTPAAHPSVELGFSKPISIENYFVNWGLVGQTGFSSQQVSLVFPSGYSAPQDTHLNTFISSVGGKIELAIPQYSAWYFNTSARLGRISYTQTSLNDLAQFSQAANFWSWSLGASYDFQDNYQITLDYCNRRLNEKSSLQVQNENAELGLRMVW